MSRTIKVTDISQAEDYINRQQHQINDLKGQLAGASAEAKKAAQAEATARLNILRTEMAQMGAETYAKFSSMENEFAEMDRQHRQEMQEQSKWFCSELGNLKNWTADSIERMGQQVDQKFRKVASTIGEQQKKIEQLFKNDADKERKASKMLQDLAALSEAVGGRCNHQKFAPDRYAQLYRRLAGISSSGLPAEALMARITEITDELYEMEDDVLRAQIKFEMLRQQVLNEAEELLLTISKNRTNVFFTDESGKPILDSQGKAINVEIDFWTKGAYGELEEKIKALDSEIIAGKDTPELTESRLLKILAEINKSRQDQEELVFTAVRRGLASQERRNISTNIIKALKQQGFSLKKTESGNAYNYMGSDERPNDFREGVVAILKHGTGMEITVIVHPNEDMTANRILFQRNNDSGGTEEELRKSINGVRNIIAQEGYDLGEPAEPAGTGDNRQLVLTDFGHMQKEGLSTTEKQEMGLLSVAKQK